MSSNITLSSATRQNLLSLQDTANLLSTTQNRLSTGKTVNSALDNPVNFFTANSLTSRSNSLSSLLDGISNGIQTIQAANTGLTKLQGLTDQLKSVAQQALASSNAFTAKAQSVSGALTGATATNLLSTGATQAVADTALGTAGPAVAATSTGTTYAAPTAAQTLTINGKDIQIGVGATIDQAIAAINAQSSVTGVKAAGDASPATKIVLTGAADGSSFTVKGSAAAQGFATTETAVNGTFQPGGTTLATAIGFKAGDNFTVNGQTVNITAGDTLSSLAQKVTVATNGTVSASFDASTRKFTFTAADSDTAVTLGNGSSATSLVSNLGYNTTNFAAGLGTSGSTSPLSGKSLSVQVGNGQNISFTFGTAAGQVQSLTQLNAVLAGANAQATFDGASGKLTVTTANDFGAENLSVTAGGTGNPFNTGTSTAVIGGDGANTRNNLVTSYNGLLNQINQLAADSGYNGVNLLSGDNLKLSFNEKNTSSLSIQGTTINAASLGLSAIGTTDFQENGNINKLISTVNSASNVLKSQASSLGSNLAVVQNRQDFTKQIVNVLDTGAAALTNADLNEEAANSQALSTRNSLGISALSLANQAQQGILQLLR